MSIMRAFRRRSSATSSGSSKGTKRDTDSTFDDEAHRLFAALNLPPAKGARRTAYDDLNAVWQHPTSGGKVFIGNQTAASSRTLLDSHNISCVVNCTTDMQNYFEKDPKFSYFRFKIATWYSFRLINEPNGASLFFAPVFDWIGSMLEEGRSVLIHCLAGAHRAGTTGTTFVMHAANLSLKEALAIVKHIRPVVQPIGTLGQLARLYDKERKAMAAERPSPPMIAAPKKMSVSSAGATASVSGSGRQGGTTETTADRVET
jgi:hypothetical protein